jgi:peptidyl-dipeptidase Dcp
MKKYFMTVFIIGLLFMAFNIQDEKNPFLTEWDTPFGTPPFDKIKQEHYLPAFKEGINQHKEEINVIVNDNSAPTFKNTIEALEYSGSLLTKVSRIFYAMTESMTNDDLQAINKEVTLCYPSTMMI